MELTTPGGARQKPTLLVAGNLNGARTAVSPSAISSHFPFSADNLWMKFPLLLIYTPITGQRDKKYTLELSQSPTYLAITSHNLA